jgi:hypothetical protein
MAICECIPGVGARVHWFTRSPRSSAWRLARFNGSRTGENGAARRRPTSRGATLLTPRRSGGCCRFAALPETTAAIHDFEAASPINRRRPQGRLMALKLRPTGLSSGIDQDREDYAVFCGHYFAL